MYEVRKEPEVLAIQFETKLAITFEPQLAKIPHKDSDKFVGKSAKMKTEKTEKTSTIGKRKKTWTRLKNGLYGWRVSYIGKQEPVAQTRPNQAKRGSLSVFSEYSSISSLKRKMGVLGNKEFGGNNSNSESFASSEDSDGPKTKKTKNAI